MFSFGLIVCHYYNYNFIYSFMFHSLIIMLTAAETDMLICAMTVHRTSFWSDMFKGPPNKNQM